MPSSCVLGGRSSTRLDGGEGAGGASTATAGGEARAAAATGASAVSSTPSAIATAHGTTLVSSCPSRANQVGVHFISKVPIANDDIFERPNDLELARYFGPSHREEPKTGQIVFSNALIT